MLTWNVVAPQFHPTVVAPGKSKGSVATQNALQWFPLLCGIFSTGGLKPDDLLWL